MRIRQLGHLISEYQVLVVKLGKCLRVGGWGGEEPKGLRNKVEEVLRYTHVGHKMVLTK